MVKADSLDFTEQEYKQFKEKYSEHLYFPEYKDDFGAYIPFVNTYLSYITNKDCKYMVGNQTIQVEMIKNYEQLQQSGQALYNSIEDMQRLKRSSETVNRLEEVRCNNRKLWVKCRLKPSNHPGIGYDILVEVSFRKKGAFGAWYNYSSKSELGWDGGMSWEKSGYSSHDYLWAKTGQPFKGRMWVKFRGFGSKCGDTKYFFNVNL